MQIQDDLSIVHRCTVPSLEEVKGNERGSLVTHLTRASDRASLHAPGRDFRGDRNHGKREGTSGPRVRRNAEEPHSKQQDRRAVGGGGFCQWELALTLLEPQSRFGDKLLKI